MMWITLAITNNTTLNTKLPLHLLVIYEEQTHLLQ